MDVAVLISGGKDSALALYRVLKTGYTVKYLVTMIPQREDSWLFHYPNIRLTHLFAEAVGIPLVKAETTGIKEEELKDLKNLLKTLDIRGIVSGAISSEYQKQRIDQICTELGFRSIAPLWLEDPVKLMEDLIKLGFQVIITGVYAHGFDQKWIGRVIDTAALRDLIELNKKYEVSIVGEGGEYETLVLDAPYFRKKINITKARIEWKGNAGSLIVQEAGLQEKVSSR